MRSTVIWRTPRVGRKDLPLSGEIGDHQLLKHLVPANNCRSDWRYLTSTVGSPLLVIWTDLR